MFNSNLSIISTIAASSLFFVACSDKSGNSSALTQEQYIQKIENYNNGDGISPKALVLSDYSNAKVTGVTSDNIDVVNENILNQATGGADSLVKIQNIVNNLEINLKNYKVLYPNENTVLSKATIFLKPNRKLDDYKTINAKVNLNDTEYTFSCSEAKLNELYKCTPQTSFSSNSYKLTNSNEVYNFRVDSFLDSPQKTGSVFNIFNGKADTFDDRDGAGKSFSLNIPNNKEIFYSLNNDTNTNSLFLNFDYNLVADDETQVELVSKLMYNLKDLYNSTYFTRTADKLRINIESSSASKIEVSVNNQAFVQYSLNASLQDIDLDLTNITGFLSNIKIKLVNPTSDNIPTLQNNIKIRSISLVDEDGQYPDFPEDTAYENASIQNKFLDWERFITFSAVNSNANAEGLVYDNYHKDKISISGVGMFLDSLISSLENGYITQVEFLDKALSIVKTIDDNKANISHKGVFYHFISPSYQRFGDSEVSLLDSSFFYLALDSLKEYVKLFSDSKAREISTHITAIENNLDSSYFVHKGGSSDARDLNQIYLAWKPDQKSDFNYQVAGQSGYFAGTATNPATYDYYTDENQIMILSTIKDKNEAASIWDAMLKEKEGGNFIKTFPGALFTYNWLGMYFKKDILSLDKNNVDWFENTKLALLSSINYADDEKNTLASNRHYFGYSESVNAFDIYFAETSLYNALYLPRTTQQFIPDFIKELSGTNLTYNNRSNAYNSQAIFHSGTNELTLNLESLQTACSSCTLELFYASDLDVPTNQDVNLTLDINSNQQITKKVISTAISGSSGAGWNNFKAMRFDMVNLNSGVNVLKFKLDANIPIEFSHFVITNATKQATRNLNYGVSSIYALSNSLGYNATIDARIFEAFDEFKRETNYNTGSLFGMTSYLQKDISVMFNNYLNKEKSGAKREAGSYYFEHLISIHKLASYLGLDAYLRKEPLHHLFISDELKQRVDTIFPNNKINN